MTPVFFGASESVRRVIGGRVVSRVVQIPDVQLVSTEGIGGDSTIGDGSGCAGGAGLVMMVVVLRCHGSASEGERGRSGQNNKSHDGFLVSCF
jgi:hypothetical protein